MNDILHNANNFKSKRFLSKRYRQYYWSYYRNEPITPASFNKLLFKEANVVSIETSQLKRLSNKINLHVHVCKAALMHEIGQEYGQAS